MWGLCRSWASFGVGRGEFPLNLKSGESIRVRHACRERERERDAFAR